MTISCFQWMYLSFITQERAEKTHGNYKSKFAADKEWMFESPGYFGVYKTIRSKTYCCIILYMVLSKHSAFGLVSMRKRNCWESSACSVFHCLFLSTVNKPSPLQQSSLKTQGLRLACSPMDVLSSGKCLFPPSLLCLLPPLPQKPLGLHATFHTLLDGFFCQINNLNPVGHVHVMCLPSAKGIWHSHQPRYSQCIPVKHQLVITTTHHRTIHCKGRGIQGWSLVCFS